MSYAVEFTRQADEDLARLPPLTASAVLDAIDRLAQDPIGLSRPSRFPYLPGRQMYQFWTKTSEGDYWVTVFFRYGQDEQRIIIPDIGAQRIAAGPN